MSIHKEGYSTLLGTLIILLLAHFIVIRYTTWGHRSYFLFAICSILFYAFLLSFFRNPHREVFLQENSVLSPADGKIVAVQKVIEEEYFQDKRIQISIFMSPFNVHVNRSPITGLIKFFKYHPGKYLVAWHPKSSTKNERTTTVVEGKNNSEILFRQIAGFVARRIVFYPQEGDEIQQGDEVGFIKFGSRVDLFLPLDAQLNVRVGDKVTGGISIIAKLPPLLPTP